MASSVVGAVTADSIFVTVSLPVVAWFSVAAASVASVGVLSACASATGAYSTMFVGTGSAATFSTDPVDSAVTAELRTASALSEISASVNSEPTPLYRVAASP